ncbi:RagB/SusD family nutrient uptake outer membrane protein [Haoranjiania flava]
MKYTTQYLIMIVFAITSLLSCNKNILDRPPLTSYTDDPTLFWRTEDDIRMYVNGFYSNYFNGYNSSWAVDYTPVRGYTFQDDITTTNVQSNFESTVPSSRGDYRDYQGVSITPIEWLAQYAGPTWDFAWVKKSNLLLSRLDSVAKPRISEEAYKHWQAVGRFFRGFEYSRLVSVFGDVPYFGRVFTEKELDSLYKDRDSRGYVMDKVYDDFQYVLANMKLNDGNQFLNRYIAAGIISRLMLFEGTYEHYHSIDQARAKKYLELAIQAAEFVMNSKKWSFESDFKALFASENLAGNKEVLMYRAYDAAQQVTHAIGSYSNGIENQTGAHLAFIKSFILKDGNVWQNSNVPNADSFNIANLVLTRDPRFEATFVDRPLGPSTTLLYSFKHASREAVTYVGKTPPIIWSNVNNTNDAPVIRLGEVVLNWIEAKAVLAQYMGGTPVTQTDLDNSINAIRNRPLDGAAIAKGLQKTASLLLSSLPSDPVRDADVPALIWEIRRERRMELFYENSRLLDLKRWKKLHYMNYSTNPDYFLGPWINFNSKNVYGVSNPTPDEMRTKSDSASFLTKDNIGKISVKKSNGTVVTWNGTNASQMEGFYVVFNAKNRNDFDEKNYLAPVGKQQINEYSNRGYKLTQTKGWQ